jgi:hypothetical protein
VQVNGPQFIGCTERPFKKRFSEHVGKANQPPTVIESVRVHFRLQGHSHSDMINKIWDPNFGLEMSGNIITK